jgi:glutamyl-tRNA synthetase/glutamyl-Q tRNA(Asp) synthetase
MISRFAPAPTGYLHLGHVLNAVYVWRTCPRVLLRIEDHDRQRSRAEYDAAILEDLAWLGFRWDGHVVRQSERGDIYSQALERLRAQGLVYACTCSRNDIAAARAALKGCATDVAGHVAQAFRPADSELVYPGTCRNRGLADGPGMTLRVRLEPTVERFVDLRLGPQEQRPFEQGGDVAIRDREGNWTYQFAVTVDDFEQRITHVVRGEDLLDSTGRQIQLARLLGRAEPPIFLHHPLIMKSVASAEGFGGPSRVKLSKSDRDTGVRHLRAQGWTPRQVLDAATSSIIAP